MKIEDIKEPMGKALQAIMRKEENGKLEQALNEFAKLWNSEEGIRYRINVSSHIESDADKEYFSTFVANGQAICEIASRKAIRNSIEELEGHLDSLYGCWDILKRYETNDGDA